ncbi:hypothetical protein Taro_007398 [Colocasia esculenta]|uniref:Protein root UVB sensitive/RUS domain-containing protein n=1 Tax=Colocasia esculenta TaxID=4460 RepID=A0A843U076_COLES|nr:hypothetical protein [Colocasia esculenta]
MQFSSHLQSRSYRFQIPWEGPRAPRTRLFCAHNPGPTSKSKLLFPSRNSTSSGHSGVWWGFKVGEAHGGEERKPLLLPLVIQTSGRASRYVWDGEQLRLVDFDRGLSQRSEIVGDGFSRLFQMSCSALRELFVPRHVQENYMGYLRWKFLHRIFSSSLQVLATQAMFRAIGIGSSHALPSAAAVNWLLKDGLGRLSRCIYTASLGSAFDTNLKRVRFSTSILFSLSIGVELLTPSFPQHFLLLATLANIAKSISLAAYIATGSAIHRSFAIADNLGEVSAKAQLQTVCFDNLGLMLAAVLNILCRNNKRCSTCKIC